MFSTNPQCEHMTSSLARCSQNFHLCAANLVSATWKQMCWEHAHHRLFCPEHLICIQQAFCFHYPQHGLFPARVFKYVVTQAAQSTAALTSTCRQPRLMRWVSVRPSHLTLSVLTCRRPCISNIIRLSILRNDTQPHIRRAGGIWRQL
jgi:hypothetical protein